MVVGILLRGRLVAVNDSSFGWIINEKASHVINRVKNHGFGLSCGISLRRSVWSSLSSLKG